MTRWLCERPFVLVVLGLLAASAVKGEIQLPTPTPGGARARGIPQPNPTEAAPLPGVATNPAPGYAATNANQPLRLKLDLRDGSILIGVPATNMLPVRSGFGTVAVDLTRLVSGQFQADQKTATLVFRNGDRLSGEAGLVAFELKTSFGLFRIPCALVTRMGVISANVPMTTLLNVNFGAFKKTGKAAVGLGDDDYWNSFAFQWKQVASLERLKLANGEETEVALTLSNGGGYWANKTGDPMYDVYVYPQGPQGDGVGDMTVTLTNLPAGAYDFLLYGHADPAGRGEHNSIFSIKSGDQKYGPAGAKRSAGWTAAKPWVEGLQYVVLREVQVTAGEAVVITVAPGFDGRPGGVAVLNGLQIAPAGLLAPAPAESNPSQLNR
jgi:hypothetical protein